MSCKLVIVHRVPRGTNCVELYVFLSRFFSPIKKLGVSLIYKSDHALFFVVFSLRLRFASRASGTNRARSVRSIYTNTSASQIFLPKKSRKKTNMNALPK